MTPPPPVDVPQEVKDAGIAAGIGITAFVIRALCGDRRESLAALSAQAMVAGLVAVLTGMASMGWFKDALWQFHFAVAGISAFVSPELIAMLIRKIRGIK